MPLTEKLRGRGTRLGTASMTNKKRPTEGEQCLMALCKDTFRGQLVAHRASVTAALARLGTTFANSYKKEPLEGVGTASGSFLEIKSLVSL